MTRIAFCTFLAACLLCGGLATTAGADDVEDGSKWFFHPMSLVAQLFYPPFYIAEQLAVRPVHHIVNTEPLRTLIGHEEISRGMPEPEVDKGF